MSVDFPLPAGPDRMMSGPRAIGPPSLHVLDQFLDLFQGALDLDDVAGNLNVAGLGADGVGLPEHFLRQELQLSAGALLVPDDLLELVEVAGQPDDFLRD